MVQTRDPPFEFEGDLFTADPKLLPPGPTAMPYEIPDLEDPSQYVIRLEPREDNAPRTAQYADQYGHAVKMASEASSRRAWRTWRTIAIPDTTTASSATLLIPRETYIDIVDADDTTKSDLKTWTSLVHQYDIWMQRRTKTYMFATMTESMQHLMKHIQSALARSLVARYRKYLPMFSKEFDELAEKYRVQPEQAQELTAYWTKIHKGADSEKRTANGRFLRYEDGPWSRAVRTACWTLGVHQDRVFDMIEHFATTSSTEPFHPSMELSLGKCQSHIISDILYRDRNEVDNFLDFADTSVSECDAEIIKGDLRVVIEKHIETLYTIHEKFKDRPIGWDRTDKCREIMLQNFESTPESGTWLELERDVVVDKADAERRHVERQRKLAENATRDIKRNKRKFKELNLEEIWAVQNSEFLAEAVDYAENPWDAEVGKRWADIKFEEEEMRSKSSRWVGELCEEDEKENGDGDEEVDDDCGKYGGVSKE
ncbi:hypothetical protein EDD37DRAFT_614027 [Exophiala viscosa]|uniref:uncharacterized protein n=1 Tax=Exophiala viscosa TaxID=2486360 RepID=UPI0021991F5F|nr:hypothetical protein EDD37DRAFT_614027 [Exophiala viscosa]